MVLDKLTPPWDSVLIILVFVLKGGLEILHFTKELIRDRNLQRPQGLNSGRLHKLDNPMQKFNIVDKIAGEEDCLSMLPVFISQIEHLSALTF